jgi:hypothetical protein
VSFDPLLTPSELIHRQRKNRVHELTERKKHKKQIGKEYVQEQHERMTRADQIA